MKIQKSTFRETGIFISLIITLLINSYQLVMVVFDLSPPHKGPADIFKHLPSVAIDLTVNVCYCFLVSWCIYELNMYLIRRIKRWYNFTFRLVISCAVIMLLTYLIANSYIHLAQITGEIKWGVIMHFRSRGGMIMFLIMGVVQIIYLIRKNQEQQLEMERLSAENMRAQYIALKNQIDPHFLFNSLNTLNGLITIDSQRAHDYVQQLSSIFRYSLQSKETVSVDEEIEFAHTYGELMCIRYGDALTFKYNITEVMKQEKIFPFSLQILIENAVKHNTISPQKPLTIEITSDIANNCIRVENTINLKREREPGTGIGLANLSKRYELLALPPIEISRQNNTFSVSLPIIPTT